MAMLSDIMALNAGGSSSDDLSIEVNHQVANGWA